MFRRRGVQGPRGLRGAASNINPRVPTLVLWPRIFLRTPSQGGADPCWNPNPPPFLGASRLFCGPCVPTKSFFPRGRVYPPVIAGGKPPVISPPLLWRGRVEPPFPPTSRKRSRSRPSSNFQVAAEGNAGESARPIITATPALFSPGAVGPRISNKRGRGGTNEQQVSPSTGGKRGPNVGAANRKLNVEYASHLNIGPPQALHT